MEAGIYNEMRDYKPLVFTVGAGQMIKGFDEGVVGMEVGEEKNSKNSSRGRIRRIYGRVCKGTPA